MKIGRSTGKKLCLLLLLMYTTVAAYSQQSPPPFANLVRDSAKRLDIARQVAFAKWDSGSPVEDQTREALVLQHAVAAGRSKGLDEAFLGGFFRAQIEANKIVQYSLLASWLRAGMAPSHAAINLATEIRPQLDLLQSSLIDDLLQTAQVRSLPDCQTLVAKAVQHYLDGKEGSTELDRIALDRSLASFCAH